MDLASMPEGRRRALAADPQTDPETLTLLAASWAMCPAIVENPTTPDELRERIFRDWPQLRPRVEPVPAAEPTGSAAPAQARPADVDRAIAGFRARAAADYDRKTARDRPRRADQAYLDLFDSAGRPVRVPSPVRQATSGLAIASLVTSLLGLVAPGLGVPGLGLLGVALGHLAKASIARSGAAGSGLATAGLVMGYLSVGWLVLTLVR